ncbi:MULTISPECIES: phage tail spike protein [unclassified Staphylococcus]|uniref:phage tail spike protein n=1 Tax=unclassified Staphylococcus TaxID=91994 RepID=UPI0021CF2ECE|nr:MULTISPECIES: phage tail spike protein [unclassified Staphylococcus]UXR75594.1 hypothetical protein MUA74_07950 [Staphylococcus sp. IVB6233]UXR79795.1 hypothetical protein MUA65_07560 [Staphylococcus sp. IVB6218]
MIHILNYGGEIIDFFSQDDNTIIKAMYSRTSETETLNLIVLSSKAENFKERNRILIQDQMDNYREFIVDHIEDSGQYTEVECTASYLVDISTSKPIPAGQYEKMTINQKLSETLRDSGWSVGDCDYAGIKTNSWTSVRTPLEMISQLETAHDVVADYEIIIDGYEVVKRLVNMRKPTPLFKGKEIVYGKDLLSMKRKVDFSEVKTALFAFGPENENGKRISLVVHDDEAQQQLGLPQRYIWGLYEPETQEDNMTRQRLETLARTELNKHKSAAISYEVSVVNIEQEYPHETIRFGDLVRIKNTDFTPSLYAESEVIGFDLDLISGDCTYTFGKIVEHKESDLRRYFESKLGYIQQKMNDQLTNVNTILQESLSNELQHFERKIFKSIKAPVNPVNDTLWLDTSNPKVAVLRRYFNGEWHNATAEKASDVGAVTREQSMFSDLTNAFINLNIQHSKLLKEVAEVVNSEYFVSTMLKSDVQMKLNETIGVFNKIKNNLDSMTSETATIGKLVDTQAFFLEYRAKLQALYTSVEAAKIEINKRFKLLQSQYTDKKFNDAMQNVATGIGGTWNAETGQLLADIPSQKELEDALKTYINGKDAALKQLIDGEVNSKITQTKNELSSNIRAVSAKVDGIQVGGRNLVTDSHFYSGSINGWSSIYGNQKVENHILIKEVTTLTAANRIERQFSNLIAGETYTLTVYANVPTPLSWRNFMNANVLTSSNTPIVNQYHNNSVTFTATDPTIIVRGYVADAPIGTLIKIDWFKLEKGNKATDWTPAPEDIQANIAKAQSYTDENLKPITTTQTQQSSDIKQLKDVIALKADKTEVTTLYDTSIKPLQTQVNEQKAQLDVLPAQINSKVSQTSYDADQNNIVTRLNSADTQRQQLSNAINDRVTIKEYTDNKATTTNQINTAVNNVQVGGRNLVTDSHFYSGSINEWSSVYGNQKVENHTLIKEVTTLSASNRIERQFSNLTVGENYTLSVYTSVPVALEWRNFMNANVMNFNNSSAINRFYVTSVTFTPTDTTVAVRGYLPNAPIGTLIKIDWFKLEKGNKATDWTPAPEDVQADIDKTRAETDKTLDVMQTQINQNGTDINARATSEEFNASRKTLSRILAELTINTTTGLSFRYDENGSIQSHTVGPDGIMLRGDRVNINVNKDFQVLAGNVNNKVGKDEIINRLNLSQEGLDINVNNIGIRGGDSINYINIKNDALELNGRYDRVWRETSSTNTVNTVMKNGYLSFSNYEKQTKLSFSDFGISTFLDGSGDDLTSGTIEFFSTEYSDVRGLTLFSSGVLGLQSNLNKVMIDSYASVNIESRQSPIYFRPYKLNRPGHNTFALTVSNETLDYKTNGYILYGSDINGFGSGLRFYKASSNPRVEVVDGSSTGGGNTTIEAGVGEFNLIKRRAGNGYIGMQSQDILIAGSDSDGDRLASKAVYNRTYSYGANVYVTTYGTLGRATSASKYKLDIDNQYKTEDEQLEHSKSILNLNVKHWFDKAESETYAKEIEAGKRLSDDFFVIKRHSGLIAEDVENVGLSEFVTYDSNGEIEGIQYDRLWVHLIPVIKHQQKQIKQLEEQINESK